jgi:1,4-dihydroxy-2-naphthoate octaprenyltransferase
MASARDWLAAARPKTLPAAVVPVWLGCILASGLEGVFHAGLAAATLASAVLIQVATNLFNDAIDFEKGADTQRRIGPRRITASGVADHRHVLVAGVVCLVAASVIAVPLIIARGWPVLVIGVPSLYFSYGYTGGPLPLAYRGLGELFVILFFGLVAVGGTYLIQVGTWPPGALLLGTQVGLLSTALIAVNNLRDVGEDRSTGKRTLAVRFGVAFGKAEVVACVLVPHILGLLWAAVGLSGLWLWPLLALPVGAVVVVWTLRSKPGPVLNRVLGLSALHLVGFAAGFTIGAMRL